MGTMTETLNKPRHRYKLSELKDALTATNGNVFLTSQKLGISRWAIYKRIKDHPELQEIVESGRDELVDISEKLLRTILLNPEHPDHWHAINLVLRTLGRNRGYTERTETFIGSGDNNINIYLPDNNRDVIDGAVREIGQHLKELPNGD
jgi:hypothetical protein